MQAVVWHGKRDVRVDRVPDPIVKEPIDVIVRITSSEIRGSDLHLYELQTSKKKPDCTIEVLRRP